MWPYDIPGSQLRFSVSFSGPVLRFLHARYQWNGKWRVSVERQTFTCDTGAFRVIYQSLLSRNVGLEFESVELPHAARYGSSLNSLATFLVVAGTRS